MLSDAGEDVHFTREDQFERSVRIRCADQFGMLNAATQKKIVSAARRDTHPHALPVDVFDSANRRSRRHEVSTFDLYIRSGEINLVCPARIDRQECHVPSTVFHGVEHFSSRVESDKLHRQVDALTKLVRQINGHAAECTAAGVFSRKHRIAIIDANAQLAGRREIRKHGSRDRFSHWQIPNSEWKLLLSIAALSRQVRKRFPQLLARFPTRLTTTARAASGSKVQKANCCS